MGHWQDGERAYDYPFGTSRWSLPEARAARGGTIDRGSEAWLPRKLHMRRRFESLEPNPGAGGRRRWPLLDSLGRELCLLEQTDAGFEVTRPVTGEPPEPGAGERTGLPTAEPIYASAAPSGLRLECQGRGCMDDERLEQAHALVKLDPRDRDALPADASIVPYRLAGFLARSALPERNERGQAIRGGVDDYDTGCGGSSLEILRAGPLGDPGFDTRERFLGTDGLERTYATYDAKRPYGGAVYLSANTTGVRGGGIVRAVVRSSDVFEVLDELGYGDPNAVGGRPVARWLYGRIAGTRLHGWAPERLDR